MKTLKQLVTQYGNPDAVSVKYNSTEKNYAIWGIEENVYIDKNGLYLNDKIIEGDELNNLHKILDNWKQTENIISAIGFISYDMKAILYKHIKFNPIKSNLPYLWFGKPKIIYEFNLEKKKFKPSISLKEIKSLPKIKQYISDIKKIKTYLKNGDVYQINYTQPIHYTTSNDNFNLFSELINLSHPEFGYYINTNHGSIISLSPERLIHKQGNIISSFPIKGTSPRSSNSHKDLIYKNELINSNKDKAEHLMIVDLVRNDLGKICEFGTVKTDNLFGITTHETVYHMESKISGYLKNNINEIAIIKAIFPGGSITGAPKESAMKIIDKLENYERGIYTGSTGIIFNNGDMDFNINIRTLHCVNNNIIYPVGGGIVWDSTPDGERKEAIQKGIILKTYSKHTI